MCARREFNGAFADAECNLRVLRDIPDFLPSGDVVSLWKSERLEKLVQSSSYPSEEWKIRVCQEKLAIEYMGSFHEYQDVGLQLERLGERAPLLSINSEPDAMILEPGMGIVEIIEGQSSGWMKPLSHGPEVSM